MMIKVCLLALKKTHCRKLSGSTLWVPKVDFQAGYNTVLTNEDLTSGNLLSSKIDYLVSKPTTSYRTLGLSSVICCWTRVGVEFFSDLTSKKEQRNERYVGGQGTDMNVSMLSLYGSFRLAKYNGRHCRGLANCSSWHPWDFWYKLACYGNNCPWK